MSNSDQQQVLTKKKHEKKRKCNLVPKNLVANNLIKSVSVKEEKKSMSQQSEQEYIDAALKQGDALWRAIKKINKDNPGFKDMKDKEKIDSFNGFHAFHKEFPIVSRYAICMGQYNRKAFLRFLKKVRSTHHPEAREKGYMEDQWVRRQADYIRYLWESYQKGHYNTKAAQAVWTEAYNTLKQEFLEFRSMHERIEKTVDVEKKQSKKELVNELVNRVASGQQTLSENSMRELLETARLALFKQRKTKLMNQIQSNVKKIPPSKEGMGTAKDPEYPV